MKIRSLIALLALAATIPLLASLALASQYQVIYSFQGGSDGELPQGDLILDSAGILYGTTQFGGSHAFGTVFKLTPVPGGTWTETVIFNFSDGTDGGQPQAGVIMDSAGNLYGTTTAGGDPMCAPIYGFCGVIFELSPNSDGTWSETILHNFEGPEGHHPEAALTMDSAGNLYGSTVNGGTGGYGTVYQLAPNGDGTWSLNVLHNFYKDSGGTNPNSKVVFDTAGNLYGTTSDGGNLRFCDNLGCGTVFELTPQPDGAWSMTTLHRFGVTDGANPVNVALDAAGNLYGATANGGIGTCSGLIAPGCGTVFRLTPSAGGWRGNLIHRFNNNPGASPEPIMVDAAGNVYGGTLSGGLKKCDLNLETCGTLYKLTNSNGVFTTSTLHVFQGGTDGFWPYTAPTLDNSGILYGTTGNGGDLNCGVSGGCGTVFQITP